MQSKASHPNEYFEQLPEERKAAMTALRETILQRLPAGFEEQMSYGMPGYVVPHGIYPAGYHCDPKLPLPFLSIASQKNYISFYHMGLYDEGPLLEWFLSAWAKDIPKKPDMGKCCIRFKKTDEIPFALLGELVSKMTPEAWIEQYERLYKVKKDF